ncbi:hypothetical protein GKC30_03695 [Pseudodesulfovibrio sp. F-1]|uniref:ABC transporter substrate-binding protein n=1 Tax=Pseudodesulfovibrio alkaliphilus TaxID=2661613 RepID=A0A7K1KKZ0_9BACT|nr:ABC transporter substrate-binding protein [Pseudodesulfovibrio alkaliphilus]MUM76735.1 hypothetical protein [Pseudodesulfovibrio alkaliphilus]
MKNMPIMVNSIFIGDKVVDVCSAIGIYCKAMSTGAVPMIETRYPFSKQMECTLCIMGQKRKLLYSTAKRLETKHIVLEKSGDSNSPSQMSQELRELGYTVDILDFTQSVSAAILQAGEIFGRKKIALERADTYEKEMTKAQDAMPKSLGKKVLVLMGLSHRKASDTYLLVENSEGDIDNLILRPAGCISSGDDLAKGDIRGMGFTVINTLEGLESVAPDVIALLGDTFVPQMAIRRLLVSNPAASHIPAIANQAVFSLPHCSPGAPVSIPESMQRWAEALGS